MDDNLYGEYPVKRYEELRPDELAQIVQERPVAYWPLGLLEHHGWHLPIGFDGIKADRLCQRLARSTGGVLLPVMWWGALGGHEPFLWTHYQPPEVTWLIVKTTVRQLLRFGFQAIVLLAGHYPLQGILDTCLTPLRTEFPRALLLWGTEANIAGPEHRFAGDHAACEETSFALELLPELVEIGALRPGRDLQAWPEQSVPTEGIPDIVCCDPSEPLFAQAGVDARQATAEHGHAVLEVVVSHVAQTVNDFLRDQGTPGKNT